MEPAVTWDSAKLLTLARKRTALTCGVQTTLSVIEGHWKLPILFRLLDGTRRFGELKKHLPAATQRMLTLHLRELERDGLIHREVYREVPPKVEYSLTEVGRSLGPLLLFMSQWGHANRAQLAAAIESIVSNPHADAPHSQEDQQDGVSSRLSRKTPEAEVSA